MASLHKRPFKHLLLLPGLDRSFARRLDAVPSRRGSIRESFSSNYIYVNIKIIRFQKKRM